MKKNALPLVLVGPIIYVFKLVKAMNLLCAAYNKEVDAENEALAKKRRSY